MIEHRYDKAYLVLGSNTRKTPVLYTGDFAYLPYQHHFLTDVVVCYAGDDVVIHGLERTFVAHDPIDTMFGVDITKHTDKFIIKDTDWFMYSPGKIKRLLGHRQEKCLKIKTYMMKASDEKTFTIKGGFVHEHTEEG